MKFGIYERELIPVKLGYKARLIQYFLQDSDKNSDNISYLIHQHSELLRELFGYRKNDGTDNDVSTVAMFKAGIILAEETFGLEECDYAKIVESSLGEYFSKIKVNI